MHIHVHVYDLMHVEKMDRASFRYILILSTHFSFVTKFTPHLFPNCKILQLDIFAPFLALCECSVRELHFSFDVPPLVVECVILLLEAAGMGSKWTDGQIDRQTDRHRWRDRHRATTVTLLCCTMPCIFCSCCAHLITISLSLLYRLSIVTM